MNTPIQWQKSSFSGATTEQCVEVAARADAILIRESDAPAVILTTTSRSLAAFIDAVKAGGFDRPGL